MSGRHPECPDVHLGSCPKCERLWKLDRLERSSAVEQRPLKSSVAGSTPAAPTKEVQDEVSEAHAPDDAGSDVHEVADRDAGGEGLDRGGSSGPLTPAQKQRAYRERKKRTDPDYLKREAARKRLKRQELRDAD